MSKGKASLRGGRRKFGLNWRRSYTNVETRRGFLLDWTQESGLEKASKRIWLLLSKELRARISVPTGIKAKKKMSVLGRAWTGEPSTDKQGRQAEWSSCPEHPHSWVNPHKDRSFLLCNPSPWKHQVNYSIWFHKYDLIGNAASCLPIKEPISPSFSRAFLISDSWPTRGPWFLVQKMYLL